MVDAKALGDRGEIQFQPTRLQQRIVLPLQALPTAAIARGLQGSVVGLAAFTGMCTEAPQGNQRTDGGIEGAATGGRDRLCAGQNVAGLGRQHAPLARVGAVVAAQVRTGLPGTHLRDHFVQPRLDAGVQRVQVALARRDQRHAPGGAHGGAAEAGDVEQGIGHGDALRVRCRGCPASRFASLLRQHFQRGDVAQAALGGLLHRRLVVLGAGSSQYMPASGQVTLISPLASLVSFSSSCALR